MNPLKCSMLSASILALSTGWAGAAPAIVLDYLNLRFAPGYDAYIIEVIPAGWIVDAGGCFDGWCQVSVDGVPGFVDANYLGVPAPVYSWASWAYPNYAYYYGYGNYGDPYLGPGYAKARVEDLKAARKLVDHSKHTAIAKNGGAVPPRVTKPATAPSTTGVATASRSSRADQNPPR
jgi:uncharacterized protein YraI